ncbi:hypothetical protein H5410_039420 [Solanum commersonii]|uniref:Uncharacterized protein n=1 Tax=Solanum commersonii TaxID=4109 RepID=A0A9J5XM83_SOLCO|nr:hypothetical protein H5410_039420 [Solanum commersonii]
MKGKKPFYTPVSMELDGDSPPIWSQPTTTLLRPTPPTTTLSSFLDQVHTCCNAFTINGGAKQREEPDVELIEGTSGEFEKEKILSYKAEMQSNEAEVEHNEKQEAQPPSASMPSSLPTELSPPVEKPQKLQRRKSGTKELATSASYDAVQNAGDEFRSLR